MDFAFYAVPLLLAVVAFCRLRHTRQELKARFQKVARRRAAEGIRVTKGTWIHYPKLVAKLNRGDATLEVACLHGGEGRSSRTFASIECAHYPADTVNVRRMRGRGGLLERVGSRPTNTSDARFDEVFWINKQAPPDIDRLFDHDLRRALQAFDEDLGVNVQIGSSRVMRPGGFVNANQMSVSIRGLPPKVSEVEQLLDAAQLMHQRLVQGAARSPATLTG